MKKLLLFSMLIIVASCNLFECEPTPEPTDECVTVEQIIYQDTGVLILDKGLQEFGSAYAIKLNKDWDASVFYDEDNGKFQVLLTTFWVDEFGDMDGGEDISFFIPTPIEYFCYSIVDSGSPIDDNKTVKAFYTVRHDDLKIKDYDVDPGGINKFEIILDDRQQGNFEAKFQCSFISDPPSHSPIFPEKVRFFNGEITIGE